MDLSDSVCSVYNLDVFAAPVISADLRFAVVETISFARTGAGNTLGWVCASKKPRNVAAL